MSARTLPRVITFYSYKGGTGRTMALANVAWILASQGKRVVAMDWDLEAPGLHRYFAPFLSDPAWERTDGLIDFLIRYTLAAGRPLESEPTDGKPWYSRYADLASFTEPVNFRFQGSGRIDLVGAGRQNESYPARVSHFDWHLFYGEFGGGTFLDEMLSQLADSYDYVLIDSRTGVSDTSGICTVHLPDTLVVLYTLNNQSVEGACGIALDSLRQRQAREATLGVEGDKPPFVVFPVATRIELAEKAKLTRQRELSRRRFRPLIEHAMRLGRIENEADYFGRMEVLYDPYYAYDEVLATIADRPNESNSVLATIELLTGYITSGEVTRLAATSKTLQREALQKYETLARTGTAAESETPEPEYDVVISAAPDTRELSRALYDQLAPWCSVFEPSVSMVAGDSYEEAVDRALSRAKVVALVVGSGLSENQRREIETARSAGRRVVPLLVDGATLPEEPGWLAGLIAVRVDGSAGSPDVAQAASEVLRATGLRTPTQATAARPSSTGSVPAPAFAGVPAPGVAPVPGPPPVAPQPAPSLATGHSYRAGFEAASAPPRRRSGLLYAVVAIAAVLGIWAFAVPLLRSGAASADERLTTLRSDYAPAADRAARLRELYAEGERNFRDVQLKDVDLSELELRGVDLSRADLTGALLLGTALDSAVLDGANLLAARLSGASLVHASLRDVALDSVDLRGVNLYGALVPGEALRNARTDATTILPDSTPGPLRRDDDSGISVATAAEPAGGYGGRGETPVLRDDLQGWVWIGDFDRASGVWTRPRLWTLSGAPMQEDPALMKPGGEYRVAGNLVIRELLPPDDDYYFRDVPRLGIASRESVVQVVGSPVAREREYAVQYWAPVRLVCGAGQGGCEAAQ